MTFSSRSRLTAAVAAAAVLIAGILILMAGGSSLSAADRRLVDRMEATFDICYADDLATLDKVAGCMEAMRVGMDLHGLFRLIEPLIMAAERDEIHSRDDLVNWLEPRLVEAGLIMKTRSASSMTIQDIDSGKPIPLRGFCFSEVFRAPHDIRDLRDERGPLRLERQKRLEEAAKKFVELRNGYAIARANREEHPAPELFTGLSDTLSVVLPAAHPDTGDLHDEGSRASTVLPPSNSMASPRSDETSLPGKMFICGEPKNSATKRQFGRSCDFNDLPWWMISPARSTTTRSAKVMASTWSCVTWMVVVRSIRCSRLICR
ncbi:hypothetical protein [Paracoccus beibuensis]|uniref:hypothetical protein n=1 Tax=Paracoccus beibuensis TaxID=547602 RepID=UPI00223ECFCF|nr:hypothetical protein [Paracoccus beibuensis]